MPGGYTEPTRSPSRSAASGDAISPGLIGAPLVESIKADRRVSRPITRRDADRQQGVDLVCRSGCTDPSHDGPPDEHQANTNKQTVSSCRGQRFEMMVINRRVIPSRSVPEEQVMAVSFELGSVLDKAYEDKSLTEILAAPPSALAGLTQRHDQLLSDALAFRRSPNWDATSISLWLERWSRSPARSNTADAAPCYAVRAFHVLS